MPTRIVPKHSRTSPTVGDTAQAHSRWVLPATGARIVLQPGAEVAVGAQQYRIAQILDLETVLAHDCQSGKQAVQGQ